ncbi:MAG: methylthioribose-1-phosphate isomerase [Candidatus Tectimicrobiota bacterium]|nr:MAG: methylthioribose-1-phosphate isomerase [Candidatus Tectomicrobia bacterium]
MRPAVCALELYPDRLRLLDQRRLPLEETYVDCYSHHEVAEAIRSLVVRGAPAIGVAAAAGIALGVRQLRPEDDFPAAFAAICETLAQTRPTAVNLFWAIARMRACVERHQGAPLPELQRLLMAEARRLLEEDREICRRIGEHGLSLIPPRSTILTHCNTGALATAGIGTALGIIRAAHYGGRQVHVLAGETRPVLQGARLTAWELQREGIPVTLITDSMAGSLMAQGRVDLVLVGADRIAANGDVANKIGTYSLAVLAQAHRVPFYVAAPLSTIDANTASGAQIPIEYRAADEVRKVGDRYIAPPEVEVENPAFDVTPAHYIRALITEAGIAMPPTAETLAALQRAAASS